MNLQYVSSSKVRDKFCVSYSLSLRLFILWSTTPIVIVATVIDSYLYIKKLIKHVYKLHNLQGPYEMDPHMTCGVYPQTL